MVLQKFLWTLAVVCVLNCMRQHAMFCQYQSLQTMSLTQCAELPASLLHGPAVCWWVESSSVPLPLLDSLFAYSLFCNVAMCLCYKVSGVS